MYAKYNLESIRIEEISKIRLIQAETDVTEVMHHFARAAVMEYNFSDEEKVTWAETIYKNPQALVTLDRFIDTCNSIRDKGFIVRRINAPDSYWDFDTARLGRPSDAMVYPLITVEDQYWGMLIRGGNHRAAILHILGIKRVPVLITTEEVTTDPKEKDRADVIYMEQYNQRIQEFMHSPEWQEYIQTECYRISFGRVSND